MSNIPHWNPTPRNLSKTEADPDAAQKPPASPGPIAPAVSTSEGPGRLAVPSPLSSAFESPIESDPESDLSNVSEESFDWIGDDRKADESEYEEAFFDEIAAAGPTRPPNHSGAGVVDSLLPINLWNNFLLFIFIACVLIVVAKLFKLPVPKLASVQLHWWAIILFQCIFVPIWVHTAVLKAARHLRSIPGISKSEIPAWLEAIRFSLTLSLWSIICGATWLLGFPSECSEPLTPGVICVYEYMQRLFFFLFTSGIVISLDTVLMVSIRSSFQEKSFKNRLISNRFKVHVVNQLLLAAKHEKLVRGGSHQISTTRPSQGTESATNARSIAHHFIINMPFLLVKQFGKLFQKICHRSESGPYIRVTNVEDTESGNSAADFAEFKKEFLLTIQTSSYETIASTPPKTDHEAKIMARMIFHYLCPRSRNYLLLDDFTKLISSEAAARDAYLVFDLDQDGNITKTEFRNACVRIFREQRNLAQSVANTGSVLSILDTLSLWLVGAGLFLFMLALLGVKIQNILGVTASVILGLNFIVFDAANKTFHAVLFIFVMHPYDVGDRIVMGKDVGSSDEEVLSVIHINIQNTVFKRWNGLYVSVPNHLLAAAPLTNLSRASEQWERVEFALYAPDQHKLTVDEETSKLALLRKKIEIFLGQYSRDYYKSFELRALVAADGAKADRNLDTIKFVLKVRCKETVDSQKKWTRHARILAFVKQAVRIAGVEFTSAN
jgi:small-conductance mechanosensitive channel